jgi:hypothetical protein
MKYLKVLIPLALFGAAFVGLFAFLKVLCILFGLLLPVVDAVLAWCEIHWITVTVTVVIGMVVWVFGDICDAQARKERGRCHARK